jgi:hypothetical protein
MKEYKMLIDRKVGDDWRGYATIWVDSGDLATATETAVKILSELEKQLPDKMFMFTLKENK